MCTNSQFATPLPYCLQMSLLGMQGTYNHQNTNTQVQKDGQTQMTNIKAVENRKTNYSHTEVQVMTRAQWKGTSILTINYRTCLSTCQNGSQSYIVQCPISRRLNPNSLLLGLLPWPFPRKQVLWGKSGKTNNCQKSYFSPSLQMPSSSSPVPLASKVGSEKLIFFNLFSCLTRILQCDGYEVLIFSFLQIFRESPVPSSCQEAYFPYSQIKSHCWNGWCIRFTVTTMGFILLNLSISVSSCFYISTADTNTDKLPLNFSLTHSALSG